jgi:hypothetical protein
MIPMLVHFLDRASRSVWMLQSFEKAERRHWNNITVSDQPHSTLLFQIRDRDYAVLQGFARLKAPRGVKATGGVPYSDLSCGSRTCKLTARELPLAQAPSGPACPGDNRIRKNGC